MSDSENEYEDQDENNLEEIEQDLINETSDASREDEDAIQNISFTPDEEEICALIEHSLEAIEQADGTAPGNKHLLSKLHHAAFAEGAGLLVPLDDNDVRDPMETILASKGRENGNLWNDEQDITVIQDQKIPYFGSCGPNVVLTDGERHGEHRINLFHKNCKDTFSLLEELMTFRNNHEDDIFRMMIDKMEEGQNEHYLQNPEKALSANNPSIPVEFQNDYDNVIELFNMITNYANPSEVGFEMQSFCQTWMSGNAFGAPEFSVMSPHFQIRFVLTDGSQLSDWMENLAHSFTNGSVQPPEENYSEKDWLEHFVGLVQSYRNIIGLFSDSMSASGYVNANAWGKFVDLDDLYNKMRNMGGDNCMCDFENNDDSESGSSDSSDSDSSDSDQNDYGGGRKTRKTRRKRKTKRKPKRKTKRKTRHKRKKRKKTRKRTSKKGKKKTRKK